MKSVERLNREMAEAQREWDRPHRFFKVKANVAWGEGKGQTIKRHILHRVVPTQRGQGALPRNGVALTDRGGRLFIFQRIRYYSARTTREGRGKDAAHYGMDGAHVLPNGEACIASNIGEHYEEIVAGFDLAERINRSVSANAKTLFHGIMQSCHELTPEQQMEMAREYAEHTFGRQQLPYLVVLHPPSAEGDQRNWHVHILYSLRPMVKTGEGEWTVGKHLRTDLDNPEQFAHLRFLWAEELNQACEKAGVDKRFTHLSYAAAGVDYIPQRHLGEGLTAKVRRGEQVALNIANHRIAVRNSLKRLAADGRATLLATLAAAKDAVSVAHHVVQLARAVTPTLTSGPFTMVGDEFLPKVPSAAEPERRSEANDNAVDEIVAQRTPAAAAARSTTGVGLSRRLEFSAESPLPLSHSAEPTRRSLPLPHSERGGPQPTAPSNMPPSVHHSLSKGDTPLPSLAAKAQGPRDERRMQLLLGEPEHLPKTPTALPLARPIFARSDLTEDEQLPMPSPRHSAAQRLPLLHLLRETTLAALALRMLRSGAKPQRLFSYDDLPAPPVMQQNASAHGLNLRRSPAPEHAPSASPTSTAEARSAADTLKRNGALNALKTNADAEGRTPVDDPAGAPDQTKRKSVERSSLSADDRVREDTVVGLPSAPRGSSLSRGRGDDWRADATKDLTGSPRVAERASDERADSLAMSGRADVLGERMLPDASMLPPLEQRVASFADTMRRKPSGLVLWDDGSVHPIAAIAASWGLDEADLQSETAKKALLPLLVEEQVRLDRLEQEVEPQITSMPQLFDEDLLKKLRLSEEARETAEVHRRSQLLGEMIERLHQHIWLKRPLESRAQRLRQRSVDVEKMLKIARQQRVAARLPELDHGPAL